MFLGAKVNHLKHQTTPVIQGNNYDAVAIHIGINDLLLSNKSVNDDVEILLALTKVHE